MRALVALAAVSVISGCGGSDKAAAPVATTAVSMVKSYRFDPSRIEIAAGVTPEMRAAWPTVSGRCALSFCWTSIDRPRSAR